MKPEWRFVIDCSCGIKELAETSEAGTSSRCTRCGDDLRIPSLRELRFLPAIDISPIGQLEYRIAGHLSPFDGNCQLCNAYRGTNALPVNVVAYKSADDCARSFTVPCLLCDGCVSDFRRGMWGGRLQSVLAACLKVIWLFIALIIASIIAFILPLIGIVAVLGFVSGLFTYLARKRANPFVLRHLNKICDLSELLAQVDGYQAQTGRWMSLASRS